MLYNLIDKIKKRPSNSSFWDDYSSYTISSIEPSFRTVKNIYGFTYFRKTYWCGSQTFINGDILHYILEANLTPNNRLNIKELYSSSFLNVHGEMSKAQFVWSNFLDRIGNPLFGRLLFISYRSRYGPDSIIVFSMEKLLTLFNNIGKTKNCNFSDIFWSNAMRFAQNKANCIYSAEADLNLISDEWPLEGTILNNLFKGGWNRIVDFIPLALKASPGYILLLLSSDTSYVKYRYTVHYIGVDYSVKTDPYERVFDFSAFPDNRTKIYYYDDPIPQVLISINQYHYNEHLVLCQFLINSCLDCITTKVFNSEQSFDRYCSWSPRTSSQGICSPSPIKPPKG